MQKTIAVPHTKPSKQYDHNHHEDFKVRTWFIQTLQHIFQKL
ncbi:hypothetical protein [uncultured Acinetobacter sp.]|nr:hypothetical protein [uncultured Acinetobacter sp.]